MALTTLPSPVLFVDVRVLFVVFVIFRTMSDLVRPDFSVNQGVPPTRVLSWGYRFQMVWIAANPVSAQMVNM